MTVKALRKATLANSKQPHELKEDYLNTGITVPQPKADKLAH